MAQYFYGMPRKQTYTDKVRQMNKYTYSRYGKPVPKPYRTTLSKRVKDIVLDCKTLKVEGTSVVGATISNGTLFSHHVGEHIHKGTAKGNRIGHTIKLQKLEVDILANNFQNVHPYDSIILRCMLVRSKRPTQAFSTDLFGPKGDTYDPEGFVAGVYKLERTNWPINDQAYTTYYDKTFNIEHANVNVNPEYLLRKKITIPLKGMKMGFNQDYVSDPEAGILPGLKWLFFVERKGGDVVLPFPMVYTAQYRIYFTDGDC